jgi:RNA polymerase sigma-70 factor (ECF subfamily)
VADTEGFEEFYTATVGRLLGALFPVTGDLHEAEEVVQEAFARASTRWSRLRDYDVPEAWVRRVAMNLAADRGRRLQRQTRALLRTGPSPAVPPASVEAMALVEALRTCPCTSARRSSSTTWSISRLRRCRPPWASQPGP